MRTHGFTFYTDLSNRITEQANRMSVLKVNEASYDEWFYKNNALTIDYAEPDLVGSRLGLFMVTRGLAKTCIPNRAAILERQAEFGVTPEDLDRFEEITHEHGFADLRFTWQFAGVLASQSADVFIERGVLTREEVSHMTLGDWGSIIGTPWFKQLAHRFTRPVLGTYGRGVDTFYSYATNALLGHFVEEDREPTDYDDYFIEDQARPMSTEAYLLVNSEEDSEEGHEYTGLTATPKLVGTIGQSNKQRIAEGKSGSCPVARHHNTLPKAMLEDDSHTIALIQGGYLKVTGRSARSPDEVTVSQVDSAIDLQLDALSRKLIIYHRKHGTPSYRNMSRAHPMLNWERRLRASTVKDKLIRPSPKAANQVLAAI